MNIRASAAKIIFQIAEQGRSLSDALPEESKKFSDARDRALLQAICFGVCRWYFRLESQLKPFLQKPLKKKDHDIYILLLIGIFQLTEMNVPEYAAISETVNATKKLWAKKLINAVLRSVVRAGGVIPISFSHPDWFIQKIKQSYPDQWENILNANNQHPPFSLRVNTKKISRENYLKKISNATTIPETFSGIVLENPIDVKQLPGFSEGEISVQDGAAQLAAELLQLKKNQRVLDACAAPGGKTAHILEMADDIECIAIDKDADRCEKITENLKRLNLSATVLSQDASNIPAWWDGKPFDRILLDAPCSATGVIRRHPDIKLLRKESDLAAFTKEQLKLLKNLWPLLKKDGLLVYATCSIFPEENVDIIQAFLTEQTDAREEKIQAEWGLPCRVGRQILPGMHGMDGFYYAVLSRI
jgi:16S rRNA (cytosine967-C5)-methyltransferase